MYTVAELFCGCGGFSQGFLQSNRFDVVLGNDIKPAALRTFAFNHTTERGTPEIILEDIRLTSRDNILAAFARKGIHPYELDCLIGGPPCQGFSQMRRGAERVEDDIVHFTGYNSLDEDPRNDLVLRFLEVARFLMPKFIVIENVPQMKSHSHNGVPGGLTANIKSLLNAPGMRYDVIETTVNAADYGVPQLRERLFILASRVGKASFPKQTHADPEDLKSPILAKLLAGCRPWVTVSNAIADLPQPCAGPKDELGNTNLGTYLPPPISEYASLMRSEKSFPYNHLTRKYSEKITHLIQEMQPGETWDHATARMQIHYEQLIAEQIEPSETSETARERLIGQGIIEPTFYKDYYWSAYTRLAWDKPALTITANANFLGSGRFTHPEQNRGITMREAARLQSFHDDFCFFTNPENNKVTNAETDEVTDETTDAENDEAINETTNPENHETTDAENGEAPVQEKGMETNRIGIGIDMIGEAVPPLLAEAIARHIASLLDRPNEETTVETTIETAREEQDLWKLKKSYIPNKNKSRPLCK
jgi:DNA (cytosine-5)-methyltransferase 1